ncbi:MAG: basic secretory protein-like protein [Phycisphaerales bacterium JB063]
MKHAFAQALLVLFLLVACPGTAWAQGNEPRPLEVELDTTQVQDKPELVAWGESARDLMIEWHPRLVNMLPTKDFETLYEVRLVIQNSNEGVAYAQGNRIVVSSHWIESHPEDIGLVIHELVHIVQHYRGRTPSWVTEGIADYLRWAIYEGKPQRWFRRPNEERGYRQGYRVTAGFFLWLEADKAPGIVVRLNTAARQRRYNDDIFEEVTGQTLDELWDEYRARQ